MAQERLPLLRPLLLHRPRNLPLMALRLMATAPTAMVLRVRRNLRAHLQQTVKRQAARPRRAIKRLSHRAASLRARLKAARPKRLKAARLRRPAPMAERVRLIIAVTTTALRATIAGRAPNIAARIIAAATIAATITVRLRKIQLAKVKRARRVRLRLRATIVRLVRAKVKAAVMAIVRLVAMVIRAGKAAVTATVRLVATAIRAADMATVRQAKVKADMVATVRPVGRVAAATSAGRVRRAARAVVRPRVAGLAQRLRRELRARPSRKTRTRRNLRWVGVTGATRAEANIRATTARVAACSTGPLSTKKRRSQPMT